MFTTHTYTHLLRPTHTGQWLKVETAAPESGHHNKHRTDVRAKVQIWPAGEYGTGKGTDVMMEEADAQVAVESFLSSVDVIFEYAAAADGKGLDMKRLWSWLNIGRSIFNLRSVPSGINLGIGTSFTAGKGKREDDPQSLFGRNPIFPMGKATLDLIDQQLFQVCKRIQNICCVNEALLSLVPWLLR